jgi:hypothetical protein
MRLLRGLLGALMWIVGALLGLVGIVLCVTIILLPLGIPLLGLARRLITRAASLMLPRALAHPVDTATKNVRRAERGASTDASATAADVGKKARKALKTGRKRVA